MNIINSDTNATVAGIPIPPGAFEWPNHGEITIVTSGGITTNASVGMGDTVLVWPSGVQVETGPDALVWFVAGLSAVMAGAGMMGFARWLGNKIIHLGDVREV